MSKFFDYGDVDSEDSQWFHIKARDMDIFQPDGDSGGQYNFGTTDVTRTMCFSQPKKNIKDIEWIKKKTPPFA